jgi:hypothetical protein
MRSIFRAAVVLATATISIVGLSANQASAKKPKPAAAPQIMVTCSPNPVVETGTSLVQDICQVEANPSFAGKPVTISSTQLAARCVGGAVFGTLTAGPGLAFAGNPITLPLDNDGNATVVAVGNDCAPGSALIDASLDAPPFATAITKLVMEPPQVTPPGVRAFPNPEVEVGDNPMPPAPGNSASEAYFVFYVETNPVYAEQIATLTSDQFTERCGEGVSLINVLGFLSGTANANLHNFPVLAPPVGISGLVVAGPIDNDGNSVFIFAGSSCAAGKSTAIAEIGGGGPTYSTQFNILPPAVTI